MKNKFTRLASLGFMVCGLSLSSVSAQVIFSEDFQGVTTSGSPLVGDLPAGWVEHNVDGLTPASGVSFMTTKGFRVLESTGAKYAVSTSWYTPAGASDDWMVTPAIVIPASGSPFLKYKVMAPDASFPDGYQVYISTTGQAVSDFVAPAIYTEAASPSAWTARALDLTAYLGQTIYIAFRNTSNDMYLLYMDDINVTMLQPNDVTNNSVGLNQYSAVSTNNTLSVNVTNSGSNTITSLTIDWNDGAAHSSNITGLSIAPGATTNVNHPTMVNYATVVEKNINVNITAVNGGADPNTADNTGAAKINTVSSIVQHNVLIEEGTGTWCGWCPRGAVAMEYMETTYPSDFIGIAVHNGDPMVVTAYDAAAGFTGFPGCNVERVMLNQSVSSTDFENYYNARKVLIVPASLSVTNTWNSSTRAISATVTSHFVTTFAASNFRLAIVVVENGVTGTTSGYDQHDYYSFQSNNLPLTGAGHDWQAEPNPVLHGNMVYNHVGRALLGGYAGQSGSVPAAIADLDDVQYTFNYTLPATINETNAKLVGLLIDQNTGAVINAREVNLNFNAGIEEVNNVTMNVYPNPATDFTTVKVNMINPEEITINLYDLSGKAVYTHNYGALSGTQFLTVPVSDLAKGNYIVSVVTKSKSYSEHLIVQ